MLFFVPHGYRVIGIDRRSRKEEYSLVFNLSSQGRR
jgi:hypothetical protein